MTTRWFFHKLAPVVFVVAVGASVALAQMPAFQGSFTLPFDAVWGTAMLPAGTYNFTVDHYTSGMPAMVHIRTGQRTVANIMAVTDAADKPEANSLSLSWRNDRYVVRSLQLREPGFVLTYRVPSNRNTRIASNERPTIVPVSPGKR